MGLRVLLGAALAACGLVFLGPATATAPPGPTSAVKALGVIKKTSSPNGARPAVQSAAAPSGIAGTGPSGFDAAIGPSQLLTYHGGPVMHSQTVYVIYWLPSGFNFGADATASTTYENDVNQWVQDVAADSGKTSNAFGAISQYGDSSGPGAYAATFGGSYVDTTAFPNSNNCGEIAPCLTDQQLINEIDGVVSNHLHVAGGLTTQFALVLPEGVTTCTDTDSGICSDNFFCAYHSAYDHEPTDTTPFIYLNLPYEPDFACHSNYSKTLNKTGGLQPEPNAPSNVDTVIDDMSHEMREATDDPLGSAWFDASGNESDDKCIFFYGSLVGSNYNQPVNGHNYDTQAEWSNAKKGCYQMGAPTVSLGSTSAVSSATVDITGTNFYGAFPNKPIVKFNTVTLSPSSVTVVSPTHLTVTVPDANTTGKVTVQADGGVGTAGQTFGLTPTISGTTDSLGNADVHDFAGTKLTVHGTGFFGVKSVTFNDVPSTFAVATNGTSLVATVPAAASTGEIAVTTNGGTSNLFDFTVKPKITSFTPLKATGLSNVTINGTGLAGATVVNFNGDPSLLVVSDTATKIVAQVPDDATLGFISVGNGTDTASSSAMFAPLPSITSLSVVDGAPGDPAIHVTGTNLIGATTVKFGMVSAGLAANVTATGFDTPTVPGPPFSSGAVSVLTPAGTAVSKQIFQLTAVTGFTPAKAAAGAIVTINGQGLSDALTVQFGSLPGVVPTARTATSLKVVVPPNALDGLLTVNMPDGANPTTALPFKPLPKIVSFDKTRYEAGCTVTVTGTNLQVAGPVSGKLGAVAITPTVDGPTSFHFTIPANAVTGTVSFTNAAGTTVSTGKVNVVPTITGDPNPTHSTIGSKIVITGNTFTGTTSVKFGADTHGAAFVVGSTGAGPGTQLTVTIPATALSGKITVTNAGGSTQTSHNFAVDPFVKSFTPISGPTGTQITVTGTGFTGANDVSWPGGDAVPTNVTPTSLTVIVPPGAATGGIQVFTNVAGVDANSEPSDTAFTVTMSARITTPTHGDYGSEAHFSGTGLAGVTEVDFNGLPGTSVSPSLDGQSLTVDAPASGSITGPITLKAGTTTITAGGGGFHLLHIDSLSRSSGSAPISSALIGSSISITGEGFTGASAVKFGGNPASTFLVVDDNDITVTVPSGETGTIEVDNGGTATSADTFTIDTLTGVLINEVRTDSSGFIELYAATPPTDMFGAQIVFRPAGATDSSSDVPLLSFYSPLWTNGHYLSVPVGSELSTAGGGIALEYPDGTIVSTMGYGTATNAWVNGTAVPAPTAGDSIGRDPDGADTGDDSHDFVSMTPTPGAANTGG